MSEIRGIIFFRTLPLHYSRLRYEKQLILTSDYQFDIYQHFSSPEHSPLACDIFRLQRPPAACTFPRLYISSGFNAPPHLYSTAATVATMKATRMQLHLCSCCSFSTYATLGREQWLTARDCKINLEHGDSQQPRCSHVRVTQFVACRFPRSKWPVSGRIA